MPTDFSVSPFSTLTEAERATEWGKEYWIALAFAQDFDLYRAITGFKRALFLSPPEERRIEIEYSTMLAYFLGKKYTEVVYTVESTGLAKVDKDFPAFNDLLLVLYESYNEMGQDEHAQNLLMLIDSEKAEKLTFLSVLKEADFDKLVAYSGDRPYLSHMITGFEKEAKSVRKAELFNAICPGAGYWYIGQKQTAVTAFLMNTLFIGAATHFLTHGNIAAGAITLSLESGWYFGGIYGAGLASKAYNEKIYKHYADQIVQKEDPFPLMMLKYTF